jgi:hypothetical protein
MPTETAVHSALMRRSGIAKRLSRNLMFMLDSKCPVASEVDSQETGAQDRSGRWRICPSRFLICPRESTTGDAAPPWSLKMHVDPCIQTCIIIGPVRRSRGSGPSSDAIRWSDDGLDSNEWAVWSAHWQTEREIAIYATVTNVWDLQRLASGREPSEG